MTRELTRREKILLLIFTLSLMALGYFKLFYEPLKAQITELQTNRQTEETQIAALQPRVLQIRNMEAVIADAKASGDAKAVPPYNNERHVIRELNDILAETRQYSLSFGGLSQGDYIISRPVQMSFTTGTYAEARQTIDRLTNSALINQISDVSISRNGVVRLLDGVEDEDAVYYSTNLLITFYEMMR